MNIATLVTIESILDETRTTDATDYREWGRLAGRRLSEYPDQAIDVLVGAMTARARQRIAGEAARTRDGLAHVVADAETGQMTTWKLWTDPEKLRTVGRRIAQEGASKAALGQRMQQAADCVDAHPGLTARAAWIAEGFDVAELDAVSEDIAEAQ